MMPSPDQQRLQEEILKHSQWLVDHVENATGQDIQNLLQLVDSQQHAINSAMKELNNIAFNPKVKWKLSIEDWGPIDNARDALRPFLKTP